MLKRTFNKFIGSLSLLLVFSTCPNAQPSSVNGPEGSFDRGSVSGRVFNDVAPEDTVNRVAEGVAGVRVILRSNNAPSDIIANRISDAGGRFDFETVLPGKYTVEIDPLCIPARYRVETLTRSVIEVEPGHRTNIELPVAAQRRITGTIFIDNDGDGRYEVGKDTPAAGARISVDGQFAVSRADGTYFFRDLPGGRICILVTWPGAHDHTHVVLYLPPGPVTNRIVNISRQP
jgi:hypothetical protein